MITLPGFVIEEPLGRGRTGEVYRATREEDGAAFAIRKVADHLAGKDGVLEALGELGDLCVDLRSPVAVPVLDVLFWEGQLFVLEPYIQGRAATAQLGEGPLDADAQHELAIELMDGAADLHRLRVVHGDIRPSNVLMTPQGPRLVGTGIALRTGRRTGQGGFLLRDPYDAPEVDAGKASHLSDQFAVGSLLMYALTGEEGPHHFLSHTDNLREVLFKATATKPEDRYPNMEAMRAAYLAAEGNQGRLRAREQTDGPVITSWGGASSLSVADEVAPVAWPEEDEVQTRAELGAISESDLAGRRAASASWSEPVEDSGFPGDPRGAAPNLAPPPSEARWHVVDLSEDDPLPEEEAPRRTPPPVSARKPGREAAERSLRERIQGVRIAPQVAGIGLALVLVPLLVLLLWDSSPEGMVEIAPAGPVPVGDPEGQRDEQPGATVQVAPFLLDQTEVTVAAYRACMESTTCAPPALPLPEEGSLPVTGITWIQAQTFCRSLGKRLPSENEWESAARRAGRFPWGDEAPSCSKANFGRQPGAECAEPGVTAGARAAPSELDDGVIADLAGNVWELVDADYAPRRDAGTGQAAPPGGSALRVLKGGAWSSGPEMLRPGARVGVRIDFWAPDVGFRCAWDPA